MSDTSTQLVPRALLQKAAQRFKLLSEPARLELLNLLHTHGEMPVQDLVAATGQSQANVSKHLKLLAQEGLVDKRKDGLYHHYRISDPSVAGLCLLMCGQLRSQAGD